MIAPLTLLGYAVLVGAVGPRWLRNARWPQRSPGLGILAWQALTGSVLISVFLAGAALALPTLPITTNLADLLYACALALRAHYATPGGAAVAAAGAVLAAGVAGRMAYCLISGWSAACRRRSEQRQVLQVLAHRDPRSGVLVVPHHTPAVYCMPGRRGEVVATTGALETLDGPEVAAVLAHERAHLRARHDIVLAVAGALWAAFPFIPLFGTAHTELSRLVEMHADDAALAGTQRRVLATALVRLAGATHPTGTLGAGGDCALSRVRRLAHPVPSLGRAGAVLAVTGALTVVLVPLLIAAAPALAATAITYCPIGFPA